MEIAQSVMESTEPLATTDETTVVPVQLMQRRHVRLPLARVKHIMKMDPDCHIISQDAVFLVTKATELFVEVLSKEVVKYTNQNKRKTVLKRDLDAALEATANFCFLDGTL